MKKLIAVIAVLCLHSLAYGDNLAGTFKTINMDGSSADWSSGDVMYPDSEIDDGTPLETTYSEVYVCNDAGNLYIGLATKGTGGGNINNTCTRNLYIDTDMNPSTGFKTGWMTAGYDCLVQYGAGGTSYGVFEFTGAIQSDWSWNFLGLITYSYSDSFIEWAIPRVQLDETSEARLEFNVTGTGVTIETWADLNEAKVGIYTFGIPEPAFVGLGFIGIFAFIRRK